MILTVSITVCIKINNKNNYKKKHVFKEKTDKTQ